MNRGDDDTYPPARSGGPGAGRGRVGPPRGRRGARLADPVRRTRVLLLVILVLVSVFAAQLIRLQGIDAHRVAEQARDVRSRPTIIPATRGALQDRNGVPLAKSLKRFDVVADQVAVREYARADPATGQRRTVGAAGAAAALGPFLHRDTGELTRLLTGEARWVPLARKVEPELWGRIAALRIPGITRDETSIRVYPGGSPVAATIGWVGADGQAADDTGGGLELLLDDQLTGTPGRMVREYSLDDRVIPMGHSQVTPAVSGTDVRLTLDSDLNYYAWAAISEQVEASDADWGSVVVMDRQGRLRALAQSPTFDPADRAAAGSDVGSSPFQDAFEPGSTAKVMSIGAALEERAVTPTTPFEVPNRIKRSDATIRDSHDHETLHLTTAGILAQSSNIGTILAAEKVPPGTLERYYRKFGVGARSTVGFPGETPGLFKPSGQWQGSERYTVMYGQGVALNAIQAAGIFQTIANGGVRIPATLVEGTTGPDGRYTPAPLPEGERVVSEQTAKDLSIILRSVVSEGGTATQAAIPGLPVAGKTGTANQTGGGMAASFIGYSPADSPEYIVGVTVYNPKKGYYGGSTAGPVFQKVMTYALQKSGAVPTDEHPPLYPLEVGETVDPNAPRVEPGAIPNAGPVPSGRHTLGGVPAPPRTSAPVSTPAPVSLGRPAPDADATTPASR